MMSKCLLLCAAAVVVMLAGMSSAGVVSVTGDPGADGFNSCGNALDNGVYVRGNGNYGYDAYGAGFSIQSGSNLANGTTWLAGDTVLAVGGKFASVTAAEAGWSGFTGNAVNSLLSSVSSGPKLQAKFGNSAAAWTASTVAPGAGNGAGSLSYGDGDLVMGAAIQIRTGTYYTAITSPGWSTNAGVLMALAKDSHIESTVSSSVLSLNAEVARIIWTYDSTTQKPGSWELLLNVSLIGRNNPSYAGLLPGVGDDALMTVQDNDGGYTDALINTVPEPMTIGLLAFGGLMLRRRMA